MATTVLAALDAQDIVRRGDLIQDMLALYGCTTDRAQQLLRRLTLAHDKHGDRFTHGEPQLVLDFHKQLVHMQQWRETPSCDASNNVTHSQLHLRAYLLDDSELMMHLDRLLLLSKYAPEEELYDWRLVQNGATIERVFSMLLSDPQNCERLAMWFTLGNMSVLHAKRNCTDLELKKEFEAQMLRIAALIQRVLDNDCAAAPCNDSSHTILVAADRWADDSLWQLFCDLYEAHTEPVRCETSHKMFAIAGLLLLVLALCAAAVVLSAPPRAHSQ